MTISLPWKLYIASGACMGVGAFIQSGSLAPVMAVASGYLVVGAVFTALKGGKTSPNPELLQKSCVPQETELEAL